jgi:hypothetical protein
VNVAALPEADWEVVPRMIDANCVAGTLATVPLTVLPVPGRHGDVPCALSSACVPKVMFSSTLSASELERDALAPAPAAMERRSRAVSNDADVRRGSIRDVDAVPSPMFGTT